MNELEKLQKNVDDLQELKTSQENTVKELKDLNQKEKLHSEKVRERSFPVFLTH